MQKFHFTIQKTQPNPLALLKAQELGQTIFDIGQSKIMWVELRQNQCALKQIAHYKID
jgi:hypothetical protein